MVSTRTTGRCFGGESALLLAVAAATFAAFAAEATLPPNVVYRNDFNTRESEAPIPATNVWHVASPYRTNAGMLCNRPTTHEDDGSFSTYAQLSSRLPYYWKAVYASRPSMDGWVMPFFNYNNAYTLFDDLYTKNADIQQVYIPTDGAYKLTPYMLSVGGNMCFT